MESSSAFSDGGLDRSAGQALRVGSDDPDVLGAILESLDGLGGDAAAVLRPVRDEAGTVVDFEFVAASSHVARLFAVPHVLGRRLSETLPAALGPVSFEVTRRVHETGVPARHPITLPAAAHRGERHGEAVRVPARDLVVVLWRDQTELYEARREVEASERRFRSLVENSKDMIVVLAADREVLYVSPAVMRVLQLQPRDLLGLRWGDPMHPDDRQAGLEFFARAAAAPPGGIVEARYRVRARDGRLRYMEYRATNHLTTPEIRGVVLNVRDVTEQCEAEQALQQQALEDPLTGLPNRRWFRDALRHALGRVHRGGGPLAVLLVDLDDFKVVNDSLGHAAGDRLLVKIAERMLEAVRPADSVARLGGDEFVVIAEGLAHESDAVLVAERLLAATTGLYELGHGLRTRVSLSIGLCTTSGDADAETLLAHADAALYQAKRQGRRRVEVFDPALREEVLERLHVEHELHAALEHDELVLHWQPILDLNRGGMVAAEALVRWQHPERGLLLPGAFLGVAEQVGLMPDICRWVADRALAQAAAWADLRRAPRVFVNLGAGELADAHLPDRWSGGADRWSVDSARVTLEVSERVLPREVLAVRDTLAVLRDRGFGIALDDFGAGNTALSWLQQLPIDILKLDRRFTGGLGDPATEAIVRSLVGLAPTLGLDTLAEGVETAEQLRALEALGCGFAQGYHLARPAPAEQVTDLLCR